MFNLIVDGKVCQQFQAMPTFHPSFLLVQGNAKIGDVWNGEVFSNYIPPPDIRTPAEMAEAASKTAKTALLTIDLQSIRSMREWIAVQPSAPQILKTHEANAALERAKILP